MQNRYGTQAAEAEFEPGSRTTVLAKLIGISSTREMARRGENGKGWERLNAGCECWGLCANDCDWLFAPSH